LFWFSELNLGETGEKHFPVFLKELSSETALPYIALFSSTICSILGSRGVLRRSRVVDECCLFWFLCTSFYV